jgi:hypothetical protein
MTLPDPATFQDPIAFLRAIHALVLRNSQELERLASDAEKNGVFKSFAQHPEWEDLFLFYSKAAPQHEKSEEDCLFPVLVRRIPRMGFQQPDSPIRFLIEGHEVMQSRMEPLVKAWMQFKRKQRDDASLARSAERHAKDDEAFCSVAKELAALYRDHVKMEEEKIYSVADGILDGSERAEILAGLRSMYDNEANTGVPTFGVPQFSNPNYTYVYRDRDGD